MNEPTHLKDDGFLVLENGQSQGRFFKDRKAADREAESLLPKGLPVTHSRSVFVIPVTRFTTKESLEVSGGRE